MTNAVGVRIVVLRHGESDNVVSNMSGAVPASPLTARGRRQAAQAATSPLLQPVTRVYCSTALRARQTAQIIAGRLGVDATALPEFVEVGIGVREGCTDYETRRQTAEVLRAWTVERDLRARVADGESGSEVVDRIQRGLGAITSRHSGETVALVGHVASLTVGLATVCGLGGSVWGMPLPHTLPFEVSWDGMTWRCPDWPGVNRSALAQP